MDPVSVQERVKNAAISNSKLFNENFIECEYCILSKAFKDKGYYIIRALGGNYLHLVGVNTAMPADSFFLNDPPKNGASFNKQKLRSQGAMIRSFCRMLCK